MQNNLIKFISILVINFLIFQNITANEQFNFEISEIEILEDGSKIQGIKRGKITANDGVTIESDNFHFIDFGPQKSNHNGERRAVRDGFRKFGQRGKFKVGICKREFSIILKRAFSPQILKFRKFGRRGKFKEGICKR